jgi:hypothetical protein
MDPYFRMLYSKRSTAYYLFENWPEKIEINTEKDNIYSKYKTTLLAAILLKTHFSNHFRTET